MACHADAGLMGGGHVIARIACTLPAAGHTRASFSRNNDQVSRSAAVWGFFMVRPEDGQVS